jgi:hypothetical protein
MVHVCQQSTGAKTAITEYGLGDLIGSTVISELPANV